MLGTVTFYLGKRTLHSMNSIAFYILLFFLHVQR